MAEKLDLNWMISVDDHVLEPASVWQDRLPKKHLDAGPQLRTDDDGEAWFYEDKRLPTMALNAVAGERFEDYRIEDLGYGDMRPGCYDSVARLEDMNRAGVLASMCFPSFPRFCGQLFYEAKDHELARLCVEAYNDWMIEEWCGSAPGRYIPLTIMPLWDPELAAAEVRRNAARGCRAVTFSENPEPLGLPTVNDPSRYWDPVLTACQETNTVMCMHIGSSSYFPKYSQDSHTMHTQAWGMPSTTAGCLLEWLLSPIFTRFPTLKIALSEGGIGWIPFYLEHAQIKIDRHAHWAARGDQSFGKATAGVGFDESKGLDLKGVDLTQRFRDHVYGCFIDDSLGIEVIDRIGVANVMVESDYPHSDSSWPHCITQARSQLKGLSEEDQYAVLRGNAERAFEFTAANAADLPKPPGL